MQIQKNGFISEENESLKIIRKYFLMDLFANWTNDQINFKEILYDLKLNASFTFPVVAVLEPSVSTRIDSEKRAYREDIFEYLQQSLKDTSIVFMNEEGRIGIVFSWTSEDFVKALSKALNGRYSDLFNIGVGRPCSRLESIYISYKQALSALQGKFYKGTGQILYYDKLENYQEFSNYPLAKEKDLFDLIKFADHGTEIEKAVDDFYKVILKNGLIDCNGIFELTIRLLVGLEKRALSELQIVNDYTRFNILSILKMETLQEIKNCVSCYLKELSNRVFQQDHCSLIIKKTIQYIEQDCRNVSLDSLAQKVYVTPTYLSSLFKQNTGKTFIEQLTEVRIKKAKELLKTTNLKNYEVAERVGYKDSRYFSQIFRKKVGTTPSEFRNQAG